MEFPMRKLFATAVALSLCLALSGIVRAQDATQAIIDKAIKAHGGLEKMGKFKAAQSKGKGTLSLMGNEINMTTESFYQAPDKTKSVSQLEIMGQAFKQTLVVNGDKVWLKVNDMTPDLPEKVLNSIKDGVYVETLGRLLFLKDKSLELAALGEMKIDDKDVVGLKVTSKGRPDVSMYFDKESGLLLQTEHRTVDPITVQEITQKTSLKEYKEIEGIKRPTRIVIERDGNKFLDMEILEVKLLDKLDDNEFQQP
jgi:hypothetical protein